MRNRTGLQAFIGVAVIFGLMVAACGPAAEPTATPQARVVPTATPAPAATLPPRVSPSPTATRAPAVAPTATPTTAAALPKRGGIVRLQNIFDVNPDPHDQTGIANLPPINNVFSLLLHLDRATSEFVPELATRWEVKEGGKLWRLFLRDDVRYTNGEKLDAREVVYNIDRWIRKPGKLLAPRMGQIRNVTQKVEATDAYTVEITLKDPAASFLAALASPYNVIIPRSIFQKVDETGRNVTIDDWVGSGPFKIKSQQWDVLMKLERNPDYYEKGKPYLDGIEIPVVTDLGTAVAAFRTGRLDILRITSPDVLKEVTQALGDRISSGAAEQAIFYYIHFNQIRPPWNDVRLRRAVHLAMDRQALINIVHGGSAVVTTPYFHKWNWIYRYEDYLKMPGFRQPKDQDLAEAKRLVQEAVGGKLSSKITCRPQNNYCEIAEVVAAQVKEIGFTFTVEAVEPKAGTLRYEKGDFEVMSQRNALAFEDPDAYISTLYLTNAYSNYGKWSNKQFDALHLQQMVEVDQAKRGAILRQMVGILMEEVPFAPAVTEQQFYTWWKAVRGFGVPYQAQPYENFSDIWLAR